MQYIIIGFLLYALLRLIRNIREADREAKRETESQIRAEETAQMRAEFRRQQTESKRIVAEQIRQAKELEKHEAWLRKHDEEIQKMNYRLEKAEDEIYHYTQLAENMRKQLETLEEELAPINRTLAFYEKHPEANNSEKTATEILNLKKRQLQISKRIEPLDNKIFNAEQRIKKAVYDRDVAKRYLIA